MTCWNVCPGQPRRFGQIVKTDSACLDRRGAAGRALLRRARPPQAPALAALDQRRDHLGDHVAGARDHDLVALADVLAGQVLLVVEGGLADGDTTDPDRLELGERDQVADPADVPDHLAQRRRRRHRRELPGDREAGLAANDAELAPERPFVDLDDDAVDLVVEPLAALLPPAAAIDHSLDTLVLGDLSLEREAGLAQPLELVGVGGVLDPPARSDPVGPEPKRPRGGDPRIELADRAGGRVARVRERRLARGGPLLVELGEPRPREVDLAADLDQLRGIFDPLGIAEIVRRLWVTSSPIRPSPRVAPRTNRPFS